MSLNTNKMLEKLKELLESEKGRNDAKEFFNKRQNEEKKRVEFFESKEFFNILDTIRNWMLENNLKHLSGDDFDFGYHYSNGLKVPLPITSSEFYNVTGSIQMCLENEEKCDESLYFSNGYIDYNEWKVDWISGQGTITSISLDKSKLRDIIIDKIIK